MSGVMEMASPIFGPRDGPALETPSELACQVCGRFALTEDSPHEFAAGVIERLICQVCGSHCTR